MALIKCTKCGQMMSDKASVCPNCGTSNESVIKKTAINSNYIWYAPVLLLCVVVGIGGYVYYKNNITDATPQQQTEVYETQQVLEQKDAVTHHQTETYETQRANIEETKELERKAIVGTYVFHPRKDNYASVDMYNGQKWWKERKLVGYIEWVEYLVVMEDYRVSLLQPSRKHFVGTVSDFSNGAFVISINSRENERVGAWTTLYKNGKDIGRLGDKGYGYPNDLVIDTKTRRIYKGVNDFKNKDISDVEYIMYDSFSPIVEESNSTEINRNYLSKEYEREYGM